MVPPIQPACPWPTCGEDEGGGELARRPGDVVGVLGLARALRPPLQLLHGLADRVLRRVGAASEEAVGLALQMRLLWRTMQF